MIVPYTKIREYSQPVIVGINPVVNPDEVYDIVISHASKVSDEYVRGEMWFDGTSPFMRAKINVEEMLTELNEIFHIDLSHEETKKCAGYLMHIIDYIASEYIREHSFLKKFITSKREFPEADVNYALVILAFERYLNVLFLNSLAKKEITYKNIMDVFKSQSATSEYNGGSDRMITDLDSIVMSHRKYIVEHDREV